MKNYWFNKVCCVPECTNCSTVGNGCSKEYFALPAEPQARSRWLEAISAKDGHNLKVCEDHFSKQDIFLDKNNKKKLKINSTPSIMLHQVECYDFISNEEKSVQVISQDVNIKKNAVLQNTFIEKRSRRSRYSWSKQERTVLFRLIKKYGEAKHTNNYIRINWSNVCEQSRNYNCFENEKDLKTAWQYLRVRAMKVSNNECMGTKLDRKVARYIAQLKGIDSFTLQDSDTSDDEFEEIPITGNNEKANYRNDSPTENLNSTEKDKTLSNDIQIHGNMNVEVENNETLKYTMNINKTVKENEIITGNTKKDETLMDHVNDSNKVESCQKTEVRCEHTTKDANIKHELNNRDSNMVVENGVETQNHNVILNGINDIKPNESELEMEEDSGQESDSDNEYYSLADIERKFGIKINPESEVISLLSSDESDWE